MSTRFFRHTKPAGLSPSSSQLSSKPFINLKTAKALGLTVPATLLARADEVINEMVNFRSWHFFGPDGPD